jgi:hypothetical protein
MSLRHFDRADENADGATATLIPWSYTTGFFDMDAPPDEKTVTRVRVVYVAETDPPFLTNNIVDIVVSNQAGTSFSGTLNLTGATGTVGTADFTMRGTGYQWKVKLSQPTGAVGSTPVVPRILEMGVVYEARQERRPL